MSKKQQAITLLDEILEQPDVLTGLNQRLTRQLNRSNLPQAKHQYLIAVAEGSSRHALKIAAPFIEEWTGLPLYIHNPQDIEQKINIARQHKAANLLEDCLTLYKKAFFIVVSQSGETRSLINVFEQINTEFKGKFSGILFTNKKNSTLGEVLENEIHLNVGDEYSIAATKTLTASVFALLRWGLHLAEDRQSLTPEAIKTIRGILKHIPSNLEPLSKKSFLKAVNQFSQTLIKVNHFILLSRGPLQLILPEAGLKLIETSSNIVYTDNTESFKHGPKVMLSGVRDVHPNTLYFIPRDDDLAEAVFKDMETHFVTEGKLAYKTNRLFVVTFKNSPNVPEDLKKQLKIKDEQILTLTEADSLVESLFMGLMVFQLISNYLAQAKGDSPDNPNLSKAVTE